MDELLKQKLAENDVDVKGAVARFMGNESLFLKFLLKFKNDMSFTNLIANLDQGNYEEAFKCAHTLKGVSANLGINAINRPASELTELLRGKTAADVDLERVAVKRKEMEEAYKIFLRIMEENA
ncbi:MAG: Hpt domain-containing protein [Lachnospiraceae bacterium]|nr:Hpt domain-containing protein [Lachnospiraceae bacterium]